MKKLNETYAKWFNTRHRRVGHLFQGPFKNILVERESHLVELTRYIVLNPVRCGAVNHAGDWKWSNYRATAGLRPAPSWLETDWTLAKFNPGDRAQAREDYRAFVAEARGSEYKPWESLIGQIYLGGEAFCEMVQRIIDSQPRNRRAYPRAQVELVRPTFEHVLELVWDEFGESGETLRRQNHRDGRKALALLAYEDCGLTHRMIADYLRISQPAVSQMLETARTLQRKDQKFARAVEGIRKLII